MTGQVKVVEFEDHSPERLRLYSDDESVFEAGVEGFLVLCVFDGQVLRGQNQYSLQDMACFCWGWGRIPGDFGSERFDNVTIVVHLIDCSFWHVVSMLDE